MFLSIFHLKIKFGATIKRAESQNFSLDYPEKSGKVPACIIVHDVIELVRDALLRNKNNLSTASQGVCIIFHGNCVSHTFRTTTTLKCPVLQERTKMLRFRQTHQIYFRIHFAMHYKYSKRNKEISKKER